MQASVVTPLAKTLDGYRDAKWEMFALFNAHSMVENSLVRCLAKSQMAKCSLV